MLKILVAQSIHQDGLDLLSAHPDMSFEVTEDLSEENLINMSQDVDIMTVRNATVTEKMIRSAPRLKMLSRHGVGTDNIHIPTASELGIPIGVTNNANARSVAEHTFAFMLALAKDSTRYHNEMRKGNFGVRYDVTAIDLAGKNLLIIGVGRIGRRVARLAKAFEMNVFGFDPYLSKNELRMRDCEPIKDWQAILPEMDVVTLHCPKKPETVGIISADELDVMKPTAIALNCARGGLIDEAALLSALQSNQIKGAGIDVFDTEPVPADNPLIHLPNIIVSPHSAATTDLGLKAMGLETAQNIIDFYEGKLEPEMVFNATEINWPHGNLRAQS